MRAPAWYWFLLAIPMVVLGAASWYLAIHWSEIPDRIPVHWGINGRPNRWEAKTFKSTYRPLLIGVSTMILCSAAAVAALMEGRRGAKHDRLARAFFLSTVGIMTTVALLCSGIALHALAPDPEQGPLPWLMLLVLPLALIAISIIPMWLAGRGGAKENDGTPDECWGFGNYYNNPKDPAIMVRNRMGFGYSPNFGHRVTKIAVPLLILQLLFTIFYTAR